MAEERNRGTLWVVATPLGNLEDLSARALEVLRRASCIACEDTRRTARLLARHDVETATESCHRFNERERIEPILERLHTGRDVALVSDGGTPCISDPGARLVAAALDAGIRVVPVPGPFAAATLLSASGLPADRFVFEGFLPHRAGERRRRLREIADEPRTTVLYEAPQRILETLLDIASIFGSRRVVLGREMTKIHESILRGTAAEIRASLGGGEVRGECTIAVAGLEEAVAGAPRSIDSERIAHVVDTWERCLRGSGGDRREGLRRAARELEMRRPELWRLLQEIGAIES